MNSQPAALRAFPLVLGNTRIRATPTMLTSAWTELSCTHGRLFMIILGSVEAGILTSEVAGKSKSR